MVVVGHQFVAGKLQFVIDEDESFQNKQIQHVVKFDIHISMKNNIAHKKKKRERRFYLHVYS